MKIVSSYILVVVLLIGLGCKKFVKETPLSDGTLDQFFKTKYDADAALAGMYGQFQQLMFGESQFNNRYTFWGDARSDNMERQAQYSNSSTTEIHYNSLTVKGATPTVWYIGEGAICSMLADVYMWKHDYDNAIIWFKNLWKAKSPTGTTYNAAGVAVTGSGGTANDLEATANWKTIFTNP